MCGAAPAAGCAWTACPPQVENTRRKPTTKRERMASAAIDYGPRLAWRMRRKCEAGALPGAAAKILSFQRFRAAAGARGAPRIDARRDARHWAHEAELASISCGTAQLPTPMQRAGECVGAGPRPAPWR